MGDPGNLTPQAIFSSIAGEKVTFIKNDIEVKEMGPDLNRYQRYFDLQEEYKKYLG
jgi:hypothetical protein